MQAKRVIAYCEPYAWAFARFSNGDDETQHCFFNRNFDGRDQHHEIHDTDQLNSKGYEVSQLLCTPVKMETKSTFCLRCTESFLLWDSCFFPNNFKSISENAVQKFLRTVFWLPRQKKFKKFRKKTIPVNYYLYFLFVWFFRMEGEKREFNIKGRQDYWGCVLLHNFRFSRKSR